MEFWSAPVSGALSFWLSNPASDVTVILDPAGLERGMLARRPLSRTKR